jgi:hypothetical protein
MRINCNQFYFDDCDLLLCFNIYLNSSPATTNALLILKTIRLPKDLAINGATPAFEEPLDVGRPNIGSREPR